MQSVEILVDIVKELIRLTNEGQITWEASKTTPDSGYMVLAQDVYTTTVNDNRYILKYGTNGCTLSMNGKIVLFSNSKDNPPNYIPYLQSLNANPLYQLHNAIISEPTAEIDFIANVLDGLKNMKSDVTMKMDGRTCVNGIPLPAYLQEVLHILMKHEVTKEIDNDIIEAFKKQSRDNA